MAGGFIPVVHAATESRPDEIDTIVAAEAVTRALQSLGFTAEVIGLAPDLCALDALPERRPLTVFNLADAVNGDGRLAPMVPARLDALGLCYTGCDTSAWLETLSKIGTKLKLAHAGLPTPSWSEDGSGLEPEARVIVKPVWEHGSLGLDDRSVMRGRDAARAIVERNARWHTEHFAEAYLDGREFNLALIEAPQGPQVLPIAEILFEGFAEAFKIVGYEAKWTPESAAYIGTPRRFGLEEEDPELAARLKGLALACWRLFGLSGYARIDFRLDKGGEPSILEVNMNPCLSPDAGFAAAAGEAGLTYEAMIGRIVEASLGALRATA
ncbi:D-alanine--D-alanine ligase family protein [Methyloceanibacter sp.]|uniref:D-alanine--D-alanine ligase family protein n=1 Tax=Methyloceanibacter sp. TaxID=1965321 RepID=UPI002D376C6F|nr:ATP-grasp domain-containing protein [Methyloceanibacter sp.]HZP10052.1 ATP-grasp domain-containing protein [Methyloceanibacter sp.]